MREIRIGVKPKEERLDKFISAKIKTLTRSQAKKLIKKGFILVNKRQADPSYGIKKNDLISVEVPPPKPFEIKPERLPLKVVSEDELILVIEKEAGMVVHPTTDHASGTLVNAILYHLKEAPSFGENLRPGIVHRLDKGTSGIMVVGKTQEALDDLKSQFKARSVVKKYITLVGKKLEPPVGTIEKPIGRHKVQRNKFMVDPDGRNATTHYKVLEYIGNSYSLVEAQPKTGRTHQIRVHLSSIGYPIVGDKLYGGKAAPRLFLHANYLEFNHPRTKRRVSFGSPLPGKLKDMLKKIRKESLN